MSTLAIQPQLILSVYNAHDIKIPVGVGVSYNFAGYNNTYKEYQSTGEQRRSEDNYLEFEKTYLSFFARAGAALFDKIEASAIYQPSAIFGNYQFFKFRNQLVQLQFSYLLGKKIKP